MSGARRAGVAAARAAGPSKRLGMLSDTRITPPFGAAADAFEKAILSAPLAAETTSGRGCVTAHALEPTWLMEALAP